MVTLNDETGRRFELFATPIGTWLAALKILKQMGIRTRISLELILPGTPFQEVLEILSLDFVDE